MGKTNAIFCVLNATGQKNASQILWKRSGSVSKLLKTCVMASVLSGCGIWTDNADLEYYPSNPSAQFCDVSRAIHNPRCADVYIRAEIDAHNALVENCPDGSFAKNSFEW